MRGRCERQVSGAQRKEQSGLPEGGVDGGGREKLGLEGGGERLQADKRKKGAWAKGWSRTREGQSVWGMQKGGVGGAEGPWRGDRSRGRWSGWPGSRRSGGGVWTYSGGSGNRARGFGRR